MPINGLLTAYRITYGKNIRNLWFMMNGSLENVTQIMEKSKYKMTFIFRFIHVNEVTTHLS